MVHPIRSIEEILLENYESRIQLTVMIKNIHAAARELNQIPKMNHTDTRKQKPTHHTTTWSHIHIHFACRHTHTHTRTLSSWILLRHTHICPSSQFLFLIQMMRTKETKWRKIRTKEIPVCVCQKERTMKICIVVVHYVQRTLMAIQTNPKLHIEKKKRMKKFVICT